MRQGKGGTPSPGKTHAIKSSLASSDVTVRREAQRHMTVDSVDYKQRTERLISSLAGAGFGNLSSTIDEAEAHHPAEVIAALLRHTLRRPGDVVVHCAALLYFIHGKSEEAFDWNHRPFFLRFQSTGARREQAFRERCETIGVGVEKHIKADNGR